MENEKRMTCATLFKNKYHNDIKGEMCPHCSSAKFSGDEKEPYWECKKYNNTRLFDNEDKYLLRCEACLNAENK